MAPLTILVTGASGLIGAEIAARLAAAGHSVVALVHDNPSIVRNNGRQVPVTGPGMPAEGGTISCLRGDVTEPDLGLGRAHYARLRAAVDRVVHSAAITGLGRDPRAYEKVNITGTAQVLTFARAAGREPVPFVYVSTAYVCGEREGLIPEGALNAGHRFSSPYEESKFEAETLVRKAAVPFTVVRPSIVVGTERSGAVREFHNMYVVLKTLAEGRVRSIPGFYDATLDLAPIDHVANVVVQATLRFENAAGRTFHAVGAQPHTLLEFSDVLAEYPSFHVPRYIPPESFSADRLPTAERPYYDRVISVYQSYFQRRVTFANDAARELVGQVPRARGKPYLRRLIDYCLKAGYLGAPLPGVDEVLADLPDPSGFR